MTGAKPPDWSRIEAQADQVLSEVFSEVETLVDSCETGRTGPAPVAPIAQDQFGRSYRATELILVAGALAAAGLVGGLWFVLVRPQSPPRRLSAAERSTQAVGVEQGVLDSYRRQTDALAARLKSAPAPALRDPFSGPGGIAVLPVIPAFRSLPRIQTAASGQMAAPLLRLPPAPAGLNIYPTPLPNRADLPVSAPPVLPAPSIISSAGTAISAAPVAPAPSQEPIFSGTVEHEGATPTALIRIGDQFRDYTVGSPVRNGWVVAEIHTDRVLLKRGSQRRTLTLGGDS